MPACQSCGRLAVLGNSAGAAYCLDCAERIHRMQQENAARLDSLANFLSGHLEMATGFPLPRFQNALAHGGPTYNTIQIDRSVVGAVNTGVIDRLEVALSDARTSGIENYALAAQSFGEAVLDNDDLSPEEKHSLLEDLEFLTTELQKPKERRNRTVLGRVVKALREGASTIASLSAAWAAVEKIVGHL